MIGLLEYCQNSSTQCALTLITGCYSLIVMILALTCIIKMWRSNLNLKFESLPILTSFVQSTLLFVQNIFIEDVRILLSSYFVQAITFSLVAMSFTMLYFRTSNIKPSQNLIIQSRIIKFTILYEVILIISCSAVLATLKKGDCSNWFGFNYFIPLGLSGLSMFVSIFFGLILHRQIGNEHSKVLLESKKVTEPMVFKIVKQHNVLQKQIQTILLAYSFTVLAEVSLNIVRELIIVENIVCSIDYIISSIQNDANIFLFFLTLIEATPCLFVLYVFYYLPFSKFNSNKHRKDDFILSFSNFESNAERMSQISNAQTRGSSQIMDFEGNGKQSCQGVVISLSDLSTNQSDDQYRNTAKSNHFSNKQLPDPNIKRYTIESRSHKSSIATQKFQQNEEKVSSTTEASRNKRNTLEGMQSMDFSFRIQDYQINVDEDEL